MKERMNMLRMTKRKSRILAGFMAFVLVFSNIAANVQTVYATGIVPDSGMTLLPDLNEDPSQETAPEETEPAEDITLNILPEAEYDEEAGQLVWNGGWDTYKYSEQEGVTLGQVLLQDSEYSALAEEFTGTWSSDDTDVLAMYDDGDALVKSTGYATVTFTYEAPKAEPEVQAEAAEVPADLTVTDAAQPENEAAADVVSTEDEGEAAADEAVVDDGDVVDEGEVTGNEVVVDGEVTGEAAADGGEVADEAGQSENEDDAAVDAVSEDQPAADENEENEPAADDSAEELVDEATPSNSDKVEEPSVDVEENAAPSETVTDPEALPAAPANEQNAPEPEENNEPAVTEDTEEEYPMADGTELTWVVKVESDRVTVYSDAPYNDLMELAVEAGYEWTGFGSSRVEEFGLPTDGIWKSLDEDVVSLTADGDMTIMVDDGVCQIAYSYTKDGELCIALWDVTIGVGTALLGTVTKTVRAKDIYWGEEGGTADNDNELHVLFDSYTEEHLYCIEHGAPSEQKGHYFNTSSSDINNQQDKLIGIILMKGATAGKVGAFSDKKKEKKWEGNYLIYGAAQLLIWEVKADQRDSAFKLKDINNSVGADYYKNDYTNDILKGKYQEYEGYVQNELKTPRFKNNTVNWQYSGIGTIYTATFEDEEKQYNGVNSVLEYWNNNGMTVSTTGANITYTVDGNKLILTATTKPYKDQNSTVTVTLKRNVKYKNFTKYVHETKYQDFIIEGDEDTFELSTVCYAKGVDDVKPVTGAPVVTKKVTGAARPSNVTFTFNLTADTGNPDGAQLPSPSTASLTFGPGGEQTQSTSFGNITFSKDGTYTFHISEQKTNVAGYKYDDTEWTVTAVVGRTGDKLTGPTFYYTSGDRSAKTADFTNTYTVTETSYAPKVSKALTGSGKAKIPSDKEFTFTLTGNNVNQSVSVHEGEEKFSPITYTEAGIYIYTIKETSTAEPGKVGYTYDDNTWTLTVVVEDKGGHLEVTSHQYTPKKTSTNTGAAAEANADAARFTNKRDLTQVKLVKEGPNGEKLAGAKFELYQSSDEEVGNDTKITELSTDANGEWTSESSADLELDPEYYYYFKETQAPSHYKGTEDYFWANGNKAGVRTATVKNQYLTGSLSITKRVDGYYESGKTFTFDIELTLPDNVDPEAANGIKVTDATRSAEPSIGTQNSRTFTVKVTVAKDGTATLTGIPYGTTYTVTEEAVSATHDGVTQNYTGEIKEGQSSSGTIETATVAQEWTNTLYFDAAVTLTAKKTVAKINETGPVTTLDPAESDEGFEFQLLNETGNVLGTATVKHNVSAVFSTSENTNNNPEELHYTKDEAGPSESDPKIYWYRIHEKLTDAQKEVYSPQNDIWVEVKVYMGTGAETGVVKTVKTYHDGTKDGAEIAQDVAGGVEFVNHKYVANLKATKEIYTVTNNVPSDNLTSDSAETFTFNLYHSNENGTEGAKIGTGKTVSAGNWTANFDPINYTQADAGKIYWYLIKEEKPADTEYTVGAPLLVSVELIENAEGILSPTVTYYHKLDSEKSEKLASGEEVITNTKYKIKLEVGKLFETLLDNESISTAPDSDKEFTVTMKHYTPGTGADDTPAPITQTFKAGSWQATFEPDKVYTVEGAEPVVDWYVIEEQLGDNSAFYTASNKVYAKVTLTKADSEISTEITYYSDPEGTNKITAITNTKYEVKLEAEKNFYTRNNEVTTLDDPSRHEGETFKFYLSRWDDENKKWLDWYSAATNQWSAEEEAGSTKVCDTVERKDWKAEFTDQLLYTDENDLGGKTEVSYWYKIEEDLEENTGLYVSSGPVYAKVTVAKNEEKGIVKLTTSKEYFNKFENGRGIDPIGETVPVIRNTKNTFDLNLEKKFADVTIDVNGFSRVDADYPSDESFAFDIYEPVQENGKWGWSELQEKRIVLPNDGNDENDNEWFGKFPIDYTETGIYWYKLEEDRGLSYDGKDYTSVPVYVRVEVTDGDPEAANGAESFANEPGDGQFDISVEYFKGYTVNPEAAGSNPNPFAEDPFEGVAFPDDEKAENEALYYNIKYYINFNVTKSVVRTDDNSDPVNVTDRNDETFTLYLSEWAGDGWQSRTNLYDGDGIKNEVEVHGTDSWAAEFTENYSNKPVGDYWYKIDEKLTDDSKYVKSPVYVHVSVTRESDILTAKIDYYRDLQFDADGNPEKGITLVDPSGEIPFVNTDNEAHLELYKQVGSVDNDGGIAEDKMSDHAGEKFTFRLDQWDSSNKELWIPIGKTDASDATDWKASFELNYTKTGTYWYRISEELTPEQRKDYVSNLVFAKVVVTDEDPRTEGRDEEKVYGKLYTEITYYRTVSQGMQAEVDDDGRIVTRMGVSGGTPFEDNKPVCYNLRNTATFEFYKEVDRYTDNEGPEDVTDTKGAEVYTFKLSEWGTDGWTDVNVANAEATLATDWKAVFTLNYAEKPSGTYWYKISEVLGGDTIYTPDPVYVRTDHQKLNGSVSTKVTYFRDFNEETGKGENPFADGEKITFMNTENIASLNLLKKVTMVTDGGPEEEIYPEEGFEFELFEGTVNAAGEEEWKSLGTTVADDASGWRARFELNYVADDCGDQETDSRTYWYKLVENLKGDQTKNFVQDGDIYASVEVTRNKLDVKTDVTYYQEIKVGDNGQFEGVATFGTDGKVEPTYKNVMYRVTLKPDVIKTVIGYDGQALEKPDATFTFQLYEKVGGDYVLLRTAQNDADGKVDFEPLVYTGADEGTHTYRMLEVAEGGDYRYDTTVYDFTVEVGPSHSSQLQAVPSYDMGRPFEFTNDKIFTEEDQWTPRATKTLNGQLAGADGFTFELKDEAGNIISTATSAGNGSVTFDTITYGEGEDGVHTYTMNERVGSSSLIIYDAKVYTVTVTVEKTAAGNRVASVAYTLDGAAVTDVLFENQTRSTTSTTPNRTGTTIPDNEVPQGPGTPEIITISDEPTPLSDFETIEDEDVPLAFLAPMTGDNRPVGAAALFGLLALGMMGAFGILASKKDEEDA